MAQSERRPWFPFHVLRWRQSNSVRRMSAEARGLYMELLCDEWLEGGPILADETVWKLQYGHLCQDWSAAWASVRPAFEDSGDGLMSSPLLEEERQRAAEFRARASEWGKKGAEARKKKGGYGGGMGTPKGRVATDKDRDRDRDKKKGEARARKAFYERPPLDEFPFLDTPLFREAWTGFIKESKRRKAGGAWSETTVRRNIRRLAELGHDAAIECLHYSEEGDYPKLYFDRDYGQTSSRTNGRVVNQKPTMTEIANQGRLLLDD